MGPDETSSPGDEDWALGDWGHERDARRIRAMERIRAGLEDYFFDGDTKVELVFPRGSGLRPYFAKTGM